MTTQVTNNMLAFDGGSLSGFRNRIINGSMIVAQRPSVTFSNAATYAYAGPDRYSAFIGNAAGGSFTQSQASLTYNSVTYPTVRQTVVTALTTLATNSFWYGINQIVEGVNCHDLLGQYVTLSFIFNTNLTGVYSVSIRDNYSATTYSYVTSFAAVANTPVKVIVPTTAVVPTNAATSNTPGGTGFGVTIGFLNNGTYNTTTLNAWQTGTYVAATGSSNWGATAGNFIEVTNLQLEAGITATPFEFRPYSVELAQCQRYYYMLPSAGVNQYLLPGMAFATTAGVYTINFPVTMRTTPTLTTTGAFLSTTGGASGIAVSALTLNTIGVQSSSIVTTTSGLTVGQGSALLGTTSAAQLQFNAEL